MARHGIGRLRAGGSWTPNFLFAAGEQGAWYDPSDFGTLFQDSAGTTPVTATSQPIGKFSDKSGRGNHLTQATAASRPTLVQPSFYAARADGVDDFLSASAGGGGTTGILICAAITVSGGAATVRCIWDDRGTNTGYILRINASNQLALTVGNGAAFTSINTTDTLPVGETHVVTAWDDGSTINVQVDNGTVGSVARPAASAGSAGFTLFRRNDISGEFLPGDCIQMVYVKNSAKTASERARLKTFVGSKAGLFL